MGLVLFAGQAQATYRADFFDTNRHPVITFDKGKMTWTLRNQGVERIVHYDAKVGALQTLALRDLHTRHVLQAAAEGEGAITFASPLLQTPLLLTGAKTTFTNPGEGWADPGIEATGWQIEIPQDSARKQTGWYRVTLPPDRLKPGHAYALYLPEGIASGAEVYADGVLIQKYPDPHIAFARQGRPEQIDLPPACHVIGLKVMGGALPSHVYTAEVGTSPPALQLASDWQYMHHTVHIGEDNSQVLTIHLSGLKKYESFELEVSYQIYAGEEPTIAKWFTFVSHRKSRFLMETVIYDRWKLPDTWEKQQTNAPRAKSALQTPSQLTIKSNLRFNLQPTFVQADALTGDVLMASQLATPGMSLLSPDHKEVAPNTELNIALKPELPQQTPHSLTAFWHGPQSTGQFLHQLYIGQYVTGANPTTIPIAYDTRFTYRDTIDAATCEKIIPLAAGMGVQAFVLDDGWQSNLTPDTGRYGDWHTDKNKFPRGILPISTLVREDHLQFGLWIDAVQADARSEAAALHPDWLYKSLSNVGGEEDPVDRMCFTGAWAQQFTQSILSLSREQGLTYLKTRFHASDGCMAMGHDHPVAHSIVREQEAWTSFCDTLRAGRTHIALVDDSLSDRYWLGVPFTSPDLRQVTGWLDALEVLLPEGSGSDSLSYSLSDPIHAAFQPTSAYLTPPFLMNGEAFCHLPTTTPPTPDQLEFLWSFAAANCPNFEVQGDLQAMTKAERDVAHKWIDWAIANREWLAFAQPLVLSASGEQNESGNQSERTESSGRAERAKRIDNAKSQVSEFAADKPVHGVLHLRNALQGRYGYVCIWNQNASPRTITPTFNPIDYFVRMKSGSVEFINSSTERPVPFTLRNGMYSLGPITLPAYGWAVYAINQTGTPRKAFEIKPPRTAKPLPIPTLP